MGVNHDLDTILQEKLEWAEAELEISSWREFVNYRVRFLDGTTSVREGDWKEYEVSNDISPASDDWSKKDKLRVKLIRQMIELNNLIKEIYS